MRRGHFSLEEQVGGLVAEERYELRRSTHRAEPEGPAPVQRPARPLTIRASRVDAHEASTAA